MSNQSLKFKHNKYHSLSFLLLFAYLWVLFVMQSFSLGYSLSLPFCLFLTIPSFLLTFIVLKYLSGFLNNISFEKANKSPLLIGLISGLVMLLFMTVYFLGYYPGGASPDSLDQYQQAVGKWAYNDWHPVVHTFLFFTLPVMLGGKLGLIVYLQLIYYSFSVGYLCYVLAKHKISSLLISLGLIFMAINPYIETFLMFPWKDIALAIFSIILVAFYIDIVLSKGEWLNKWYKIVIVALVAVLCTYMRHNAILFTLPLLIITVFFIIKNKKVKIYLSCSFVALFIAIKLLYAVAGIEAPDRRTEETIGLPVTIWCSVMHQNADKLPAETRDFMYNLASDDTYKNTFTGSYNSIKWSGQFNNDKVNNLSYKEVIKHTYNCFRYAPNESFIGLAKITDLVWGVDGKYKPTYVYINYNEIGINGTPISQTLLRFTNQIRHFFSTGFGAILFGSIGFQILLMIIVAVGLLAKGRLSFIHAIPLLCYNFGTMLLLSGDDHRFFLINIVLWLPTIVLMIKDKRGIKI